MYLRYSEILKPEALARSIDDLDMLTRDIMDRKEVGVNRPTLIKEKITLDTEIKLLESGSIMSDPIFQTLKNESQRDAFRRNKSAALRRTRAEVEARLAAVDAEMAREYKERDLLTAAAQAADRKAALQEALLNFLAGGKK